MYLLTLISSIIYSVIVATMVYCVYLATQKGGLFELWGVHLYEERLRFEDSGKLIFWYSPLFYCPFCTCFWFEVLFAPFFFLDFEYSTIALMGLIFPGTLLTYFIHKNLET